MAKDKDRESEVKDERGNVTHIRVVSEDGESSQLFKYDSSIAAHICNDHKGERVEVAEHNKDGTTTAYEADNSFYSRFLEHNCGILGKGREKSDDPPASEAPRRSEPDESPSSDDSTPDYDYTPSDDYDYTPSSGSSSYSGSSNPSSQSSSPGKDYFPLKLALVAGLGVLALWVRSLPDQPEQQYQPEQQVESSRPQEETVKYDEGGLPLTRPLSVEEDDREAQEFYREYDRINGLFGPERDTSHRENKLYVDINRNTLSKIREFNNTDLSVEELIAYCPQIKTVAKGRTIIPLSFMANPGPAKSCKDLVSLIDSKFEFPTEQPVPVQHALKQPADDSIPYYTLKANRRTIMRMDLNGDHMVSSDEMREYCEQARQEIDPRAHISLEFSPGYGDTTDSCRKLIANAEIIHSLPPQKPGSYFRMRANHRTMWTMDINHDQNVSLDELIRYCEPLREKTYQGVRISVDFTPDSWNQLQSCGELLRNAEMGE